MLIVSNETLKIQWTVQKLYLVSKPGRYFLVIFFYIIILSELSKTVGGWKAVHHCKDMHFWSITLCCITQVPPENALNLIYAFYENLLQVRRGGLYFKEKYYKCVRADEHSIYLQNVR